MSSDEPVGKTYVRKLITGEERKNVQTPFALVRAHLGNNDWLIIREDGSHTIINAFYGWNPLVWEEV